MTNNNHYNPYAWISAEIAEALTQDGCMFFDNGGAVKVEGVALPIAAGKILDALMVVTPSEVDVRRNPEVVHRWGMALAEAERALMVRFETNTVSLKAQSQS